MSHPRLVEIQRSRLLSAAVRAVDEVGYSEVSVAHITSRARVSRRTFYELFSDREECLVAAIENIVGLIERDIADADLDALVWRERVRLGLWRILSFFDREPVLARVCVVQALRGSPRLLERREILLRRLAGIVDQGRLESPRTVRDSPRTAGESARRAGVTELTAEGLVGAAFTVLYTRLLYKDTEPLTGLLGELMGLIVLPYLGNGAARRELARPTPTPPTGNDHESGVVVGDLLEGMPIRLTYRTTRVLESVAEHPGLSNRQVGQYAGIEDQGQVSKLLARLLRVGLLANGVNGPPVKGEANQWTLTSKGQQIVSITAHAGSSNHKRVA